MTAKNTAPILNAFGCSFSFAHTPTFKVQEKRDDEWVTVGRCHYSDDGEKYAKKFAAETGLPYRVLRGHKLFFWTHSGV